MREIWLTLLLRQGEGFWEILFLKLSRTVWPTYHICTTVGVISGGKISGNFSERNLAIRLYSPASLGGRLMDHLLFACWRCQDKPFQGWDSEVVHPWSSTVSVVRLGLCQWLLLLRSLKARSPVYYSTKMGKHDDTNVTIEGKQQNTESQVHIHTIA